MTALAFFVEERLSNVLVMPKLALDTLDLHVANPQPNPYAVKDEVWLAKAARRRVVRTTILQLQLCAILSAYADQVQDEPHHRDLFSEFCHQIGLNYDGGRLRVRTYKFLPAVYWERYQELDWGVVLEAVSRTFRKGETPEERRARVVEACEYALEHLHSTSGTRRMLEAARRAEREAEGERGNSALAEVGPDSARDAEYEVCLAEPAPTLTEDYANSLSAGRERYAGEQGLSPQQPGASTDADLCYAALERRVQELEARLAPQRVARVLAQDLYRKLDEIGSRDVLEEEIFKSLQRQMGGGK